MARSDGAASTYNASAAGTAKRLKYQPGMKTSLSAIDYTLWLSIILVQFLACWVVAKRGFYRSWKVFSYYLFFMAAESVVLLAISQFGSRNTYAVCYYIGSAAEAVLLSLVVLEILVKVLDPFEALP